MTGAYYNRAGSFLGIFWKVIIPLFELCVRALSSGLNNLFGQITAPAASCPRPDASQGSSLPGRSLRLALHSDTETNRWGHFQNKEGG